MRIWLLILIFVASIQVLIALELLIPEKYKKNIRIAIIPVIWIISIIPGIICGIIGFLVGAVGFFKHYTQGGLDSLSEVLDSMSEAIDDLDKSDE